jgi:phospholipase/lecithinase/hemolysin
MRALPLFFAGWSEVVQYEVSSNPVEQERVTAAYKAGHEYMAAAAAKLLANVKDVACGDAVPPSNSYLKGSSLGCSANTVISGDTSRYLYADGVHPTPYGHKLLADFFMTVLNASNLAKN